MQSLLRIQEDMLADGEPEFVLRARQRKSVAPHVVAQLVLLNQPELELLLGIQRHWHHDCHWHCRDGRRLAHLGCMRRKTSASAQTHDRSSTMQGFFLGKSATGTMIVTGTAGMVSGLPISAA